MSAHAEVTRIAGVATIQDSGRPGRMHEGIPTGGPLVPELHVHANAACGNASDAATIELVGSMRLTALGGPLVLATDEGIPRAIADGDSLTIDSPRGLRVRYVAIRGGFDVPRVLGGRGTLLVASLGGFEGRVLRRGDRILVGSSVSGEARALDPISTNVEERIRVVLGPDIHRFAPGAADAFLASTFTLSSKSDRTGARLEGPRVLRLDADDARSAPMVPGAIEVPASGEPIVLGPDGPTTGGYPVLAAIARADLGRFHARSVGAPVHFTRA